jgi:hypothetical protein
MMAKPGVRLQALEYDLGLLKGDLSRVFRKSMGVREATVSIPSMRQGPNKVMDSQIFPSGSVALGLSVPIELSVDD